MIAAFEKIVSAPRALIVVVAALSLACGAPASPTPEETTPPIPTQVLQRATASPTAEPPLKAPPTSASTGGARSPGYNPTEIMFRIFSGVNQPTEDSLQALQHVRDEKDTSQVRVIVEVMRFWGPQLGSAAVDTLAELTGQDFREDVNE